jgi:hypothetical protein
MLDVLSDLMKHVGGLGLFDKVKIIGTDTTTSFEAVDAEKVVILNGQLKKPIADFKGEFGIGDLSRLAGYVGHANFKDPANSAITVTRQNRNGNDTPVTIVFNNKAMNSRAEHRLMAAEMLPGAKFVGKDWDVVITPTKSKLDEFASFATLEATHDKYFMPKVVDANLMVYFGEPNSSTHSASMEFAKNVKGTITQPLYWETATANSIFKLGRDSAMTVSITSKGALQIAISSDFADFNFNLRAHKK